MDNVLRFILRELINRSYLEYKDGKFTCTFNVDKEVK